MNYFEKTIFTRKKIEDIVEYTEANFPASGLLKILRFSGMKNVLVYQNENFLISIEGGYCEIFLRKHGKIYSAEIEQEEICLKSAYKGDLDSPSIEKIAGLIKKTSPFRLGPHYGHAFIFGNFKIIILKTQKIIKNECDCGQIDSEDLKNYEYLIQEVRK
ncbi:MAG: hypothetical protein WAP07_02870 [Acutalibacteraceae bacterium]